MYTETDVSVSLALKLCNKLCINVEEEFFVTILTRACELNLKVQTQTMRKSVEVEIDLSDEYEVPLVAAVQFT